MGLPATVRVNTTVNFPSLVFGTGPITVTKSNGVWTVGLSAAALVAQTPPVANYPTDFFLVYDSISGTFFQMPLSGLAAAGITVTPTGGISSINVQSALAELDTEKAAIASLANVALSGAGVDMVTNGVAWTPVLTFATPGNLAVAYSTQFGRYYQLSSNLVLVQFNITTSAFTFTTATGNLQITGLPFTDANLAALRMSGSCSWGGITKAGYTQMSLGMPNNNSLFQLSASGSGQAIAAVTAADTPTGGTIALIGEVIIFLS